MCKENTIILIDQGSLTILDLALTIILIDQGEIFGVAMNSLSLRITSCECKNVIGDCTAPMGRLLMYI
jgi:hypothetical protein